MTLHIHLFGHLRLFQGGQWLSFSGLPKVTPMFVYLLLNQKRPVSRDSLAFLLWPDVAEAEARANLRRHLYELRRILPATPPETPWLLSTNSALQWNPAGQSWVDVLEFQKCLAQEQLEEAIALYEGDLLPDLYDDWIIAEREQLRELYFATLGQLIVQSRQRENHKQAISYARHVLNLDPLREDIAREMVALRYETGDRPGAIQEYQRFVQLLKEELGVSPMPETVALFQMVNQNLPLPGRAISSPAPNKNSAPPPGNLPTPLTSFIGRQAEIATLNEQIIKRIRLITLSGPGGTGKTRLAIEAAWQLRQTRPELFPDGFFFVGLSTITNPGLVLPTIAGVLDVRDTGREPLQKSIANFLSGKNLLLILDNFEQLLPAAPFIAELLANAPTVSALITSRTTLELYGEHEFPVDPLFVEDLKDVIRQDHYNQTTLATLQENPAISLFLTRAQAVNPSFNLNKDNGLAIAEICARLDGLPLAIELAAARSKLFNPSAMLAQLNSSLSFLSQKARNLPARQQTLRDTIAWSYNLLEPEEKRLLVGLSVFSGVFTLAAAQSVLANDEDDKWPLINGLESLVDKNMLRQLNPAGDNQPQFRMLLTIREFAQEQLPHHPSLLNILRNHAAYYMTLGQNSFYAIRTHEQSKWNTQLLAAGDNIRAALEWSLADSNPLEIIIIGVNLCVSLDNFWQTHGRLNEGRAWLERSYRFLDQLPPEDTIRLLNVSGWFAQLQGEHAIAQPRHEQALQIARDLNELSYIASSLIMLGTCAGRTGNYLQAEKLFSECLALRPLMPESSGVVFYSWPALLNNLAIVVKYLGDYDRASALLQESLNIHEEKGNKQGMASALANMANIAIHQNNFTQAIELYRHSVSLRQQLNDRTGLANALQGLAHLAISLGDNERGVQIYGAYQVISQVLNAPITPAARPQYEQNLALTQAKLGEAVFAAAWAEGAALNLDEAIALGLQA